MILSFAEARKASPKHRLYSLQVTNESWFNPEDESEVFATFTGRPSQYQVARELAGLMVDPDLAMVNQLLSGVTITIHEGDALVRLV